MIRATKRRREKDRDGGEQTLEREYDKRLLASQRAVEQARKAPRDRVEVRHALKLDPPLLRLGVDRPLAQDEHLRGALELLDEGVAVLAKGLVRRRRDLLGLDDERVLALVDEGVEAEECASERERECADAASGSQLRQRAGKGEDEGRRRTHTARSR